MVEVTVARDGFSIFFPAPDNGLLLRTHKGNPTTLAIRT